ncbi:creatininase family protein [Nocardia stercoris]|nr:creatininase family protein [Nocardia stercoris]
MLVHRHRDRSVVSGFLLPPITFGCSHEHDESPGTIANILTAMIADTRVSLVQARLDKLAIVNGHGGNFVLSNTTMQSNIGGYRAPYQIVRGNLATSPNAAAQAFIKYSHPV